jgi:hypothetical protein
MAFSLLSTSHEEREERSDEQSSLDFHELTPSEFNQEEIF